MTIQDEAACAAYAAMQSALDSAKERWRQSQKLCAAAMLTDSKIVSDNNGATGQLTFETQRTMIPVGTRDAYGVVRKAPVICRANKMPRASTQTLMRKMSDAMYSAYIQSFEDHL